MSRLTYTRLPHPLREEDLLFYDADGLTQALEGAARGVPLNRLALGPQTAPDEAEVRGLEGRLRRAAASRSRGAWGRVLWWLLLGPALSLLWINSAPALALLFFWFPPLAALIESLGAVSGGPLLATVVGLVPLLWAWGRAGRHLAVARRWGRLARLAGARRLAGAPLVRQADPAVASFAAGSAPQVRRLREQSGRLAERGADAAAELAQAAREAYRLARRDGLPGAAGAYHDLYARFDAAEQHLNRVDRAGGLLAERKMDGVARRARRQASAALAAFSPTGAVRSRYLAPLGGLLAGLAALAGTLLLTGTYLVQPGQAVIVDPPGARLARLAGALGLPAPESLPAPEVVRTEGGHWGWPRPFADRHSVTLGEQRLRLRSIFRRTGEDAYDVLEVELRFRIGDPNRWAQLDRDGSGAAALGARISALLQNVLQQQRQEARQFVAQQNPALANDPNALNGQADALVQGRLTETVRDFVAALSEAPSGREAGVQFSREAQSRLVRNVPGDQLGATPQE